MAAPKNANTEAARAASLASRADAGERKKLMDAAALLRAHGAAVTLPYASAQTDTHTWRIEVQDKTGQWKLDHYGSNMPAWFTFDGAAIRSARLEARGCTVRMC